jgi:ATP-dependent protease ClpP protease subunit
MTNKHNNLSNDEDDFEEFIKGNKPQQEWEEATQVQHRIRIRLDDVIREPSYYRNLLNRLENATEDDLIQVHLDNVGGSLDGCIAICNALRRTEGQVHAVVSGRCYSAGSIILMYCQSAEIGPWARVMLHCSTGGFFGRSHEVHQDFNFNHAFVNDFLAESYAGFLTEDEIKQLLDGRDFWMGGEECSQRLQNRFKMLQEEFEEQACEECSEECCSECQLLDDDEEVDE